VADLGWISARIVTCGDDAESGARARAGERLGWGRGKACTNTSAVETLFR
jgi:hypothetical protein